MTLVDWALLLRNIVGPDLTLLHPWSRFGGSGLQSRLPESVFLEHRERARRRRRTH